MAEERKLVTVLFCDLAGFTAQAEELDPEDVRRILTRYWGRLRAELERYGGTVEKFIGDAVVAVFGAPVARDDDPERAVRAAFAIRQAIAELNEGDPELELHVRIGVNTGEALVTLDADVRSGEGLVAGDVVNTGARLQAAAPTDGILVGEGTFRASRRRIEYRERDPVEAKGKAAPLKVFEPVAALAEEDAIRRGLTPLVGRREELELLLSELAACRGAPGGPRLVTLVGPPGIGKSRLLYELYAAVEADPEPILWRRGRCLPYGDTYAALADVVKAQAGIVEADGAEAAAARLRAAVAEAAADAEEVARLEGHLAPLAGLGSGGEAGPDRRGAAFAAWTDFFRGVAARAPLVLAFEDLHWAGEDLLDFVEQLAAAGLPRLLLVVTARPELLERRPAWPGPVLRLQPLTDEEVARLLAARLQSAALPEGVRAAVLARAAGTPLYVEEYVRMLSDRGLLGAEAEGLPLPETVQGIIAARLDALPPAEKAVVQDAAVLGEVVWPAALAAVGRRAPGEVERSLTTLEARELVRRERVSSLGRGPQYRFRHVLVRDVAYAAIPRGERATTHRRAAEWVESLGRPDEHAELLAHHYASALELARADRQETAELELRTRLALRAAGDRAVSLHALPAGARYYERALALWPSGDSERPDLLFRLGKARVYGEFTGEEVLAEAVDALLAAGERSRAAEAEGYLFWLAFERLGHEAAREHLSRAAALIRDEPPSSSKILVLNLEAADLSQRAAEDAEAARLSGEALAMAEELGLDELQVQSLNILGPALGGVEGAAALERGIAIAGQVDSPECLIAYVNLALVLWELGDLRRVAAVLDEAEEALTRYGDFAGTSLWLASVRAEGLYRSGSWDEALARAQEPIRAAVGQTEVLARLARGRVLLGRGDPDGAAADARRALELARGLQVRDVLATTLGFAARAELSLGEARSALALAREALRLTARFAGDALADVAVVLEALGRGDELLEAAPPALPSRWHEAAVAYASGDFPRAADVYAAIGSLPDEAYARLRSGTERETGKALAFYRSVEARARLLEAERAP